jgi:hypothetical protein
MLPLFRSLKSLAGNVKTFWKEDFHLPSYLYLLVFLTFSCALNYYFKFDDTYLEPMAGSWQGMAGYFGFYGFAYFGAAIPLLLIRKQKHIILSPKFWVLSLSFVLFIAIEGGVAIKEEWLESWVMEEHIGWARRTIRQWESILVWLPVYFIFKKITWPDARSGLYGIRWQAEDIKPYLSMLWIMVPLIAMASFLPDFQEYYPVYKRVLPYLPGAVAIEKYIYLGLYEISYLLSFTNTELMFRGGLVIGMSVILGRQAVLPMVSVYMFLHYGKPMGESISSVFGGYILGVLAFQNRNIWGGIFIHTCVALLMDMAASFQVWGELKGYLD